MSLEMTLLMTLKMTQKSKLYTDKDLNFERVFEIKVVDLRARNGIKQRSFSILVEKGTKNNEYPPTQELRDFLEEKTKEINK